MVEYCDTPETERREQTGNTKHTYTLEASSLLDLTGDFQGILEIASLPEGPLKHKNVLISGISKHALRLRASYFYPTAARCV